VIDAGGPWHRQNSGLVGHQPARKCSPGCNPRSTSACARRLPVLPTASGMCGAPRPGRNTGLPRSSVHRCRAFVFNAICDHIRQDVFCSGTHRRRPLSQLLSACENGDAGHSLLPRRTIHRRSRLNPIRARPCTWRRPRFTAKLGDEFRGSGRGPVAPIGCPLDSRPPEGLMGNPSPNRGFTTLRHGSARPGVAQAPALLIG